MFLGVFWDGESEETYFAQAKTCFAPGSLQTARGEAPVLILIAQSIYPWISHGGHDGTRRIVPRQASRSSNGAQAGEEADDDVPTEGRICNRFHGPDDPSRADEGRANDKAAHVEEKRCSECCESSRAGHNIGPMERVLLVPAPASATRIFNVSGAIFVFGR